MVVHMSISEKACTGFHKLASLPKNCFGKRLGKHGYPQSKLVPGLWKHQWRPIKFTRVVDDFGVKYVSKEHARHLMSALNNSYTITHDWQGSKNSGITLDWDYNGRKVHL